MTKTSEVCTVCGKELPKVHGHEQPALVANHIMVAHPNTYIMLCDIHKELEQLQDDFRAISGRYARESFYYRKERMK